MIQTIIIGGGNIAGLNETQKMRMKPATHIGYLRKYKIFNTEYIIDINERRAEKFAKLFKLKPLTNLEIFNSKKFDFCIIAVPFKYNLEVVKNLSKVKFKPKIILLEKPLSHNLDIAIEIEKICKKNKIKLLVNNRRLMESIQLIKKIKKKPFFVTATCSSGMNAIGTHMIDTLHYLYGSPKKIYSLTEKKLVKKLEYSKNYHPQDKRFTSILDYGDDFHIFFKNTALSKYSFFEIDIYFEDLKIQIKNHLNEVKFQKFKKNKKISISYRLVDHWKKKYKKSLFDSIGFNLKNFFLKKNNNIECLNSSNAIETLKIIKRINNS